MVGLERRRNAVQFPLSSSTFPPPLTDEQRAVTCDLDAGLAVVGGGARGICLLQPHKIITIVGTTTKTVNVLQ